VADDFERHVREITRRDTRYARNAYDFLAEALAYTINKLERADKEDEERHVSGQELLEGIRELAARQFGPLAPMVFDEWGIRSSEDFGEMVFNLVTSGIWHKTDRDSMDDFRGGFDIRAAFEGEFDVRIGE